MEHYSVEGALNNPNASEVACTACKTKGDIAGLTKGDDKQPYTPSQEELAEVLKMAMERHHEKQNHGLAV